MVSLFDISTQKPLWSHLSTGIPTLDSMLRLQSDALLDMQTVPGNMAFSALLCHIVVTHLNSSETSTVIVLETLAPFPWVLLKSHPQFDANWLDSSRIITYSVATFAKLYAFFTFMPAPRPEPGSVLMLVTNFHELTEFYRLQIAATHEELLLKHQVEKNQCFLENKEKAEAEGFRAVNVPPVPIYARENPYNKAQNHVNGLVSMMSDFAFKNSAVIIIMGHLEPKFRQFARREPSVSFGPPGDNSFHSSQAPISQSASMSFQGRDFSKLVLTPVELGPRVSEKPNLAESKITARLVFYNDWFDRSPYYKRGGGTFKSRHRFFVSVVKVFNFSGISNNINEPVYFQFKSSQEIPSILKSRNSWLTDLSEPEPEPEQDALAALIQNSITSTQIATRNPGSAGNEGPQSDSEGTNQRRKQRKLSIPSSPPPLEHILDNQRLTSLLSGREVETAEKSSSEEEAEEADVSENDSEKGSENEDDEDDEDDDDDDETGNDTDDESDHDNESENNNERREVLETNERKLKARQSSGVPRLEIIDVDEDRSFIEGSDVESTGTLLEGADSSQSEPEWFARHS